MPSYAYETALKQWLGVRAQNAGLRQTPLGSVVEGLVADAIWPNQLQMASPTGQGSFTLLGSGADAWVQALDWLSQRGFVARFPAYAPGRDTFDAANPPDWVVRGYLPAGGTTDFSNAAASSLLKLYQNRLWPMKVLDKETSLALSKILTAGIPVYPKRNTVPVWTQGSPQKLEAWNQIVDQTTSIQQAFNQGNMQLAASLVAASEADVAFWDKVSRIATAVATLGLSELVPEVKAKWDEMIARMKEYQATKANGLKIANDPKTDPAKAQTIRQTIDRLDSTIAGKVSSMFADNPGMVGVVNKEAGLGNPIAIFAGLGTAVQIGILATVIALIVAAIYELNQLGVFAAAQSVGDSIRWLKDNGGPLLGFAILGLGGWWLTTYLRNKGKGTSITVLPAATNPCHRRRR